MKKFVRLAQVIAEIHLYFNNTIDIEWALKYRAERLFLCYISGGILFFLNYPSKFFIWISIFFQCLGNGMLYSMVIICLKSAIIWEVTCLAKIVLLKLIHFFLGLIIIFFLHSYHFYKYYFKFFAWSLVLFFLNHNIFLVCLLKCCLTIFLLNKYLIKPLHIQQIFFFLNRKRIENHFFLKMTNFCFV